MKKHISIEEEKVLSVFAPRRLLNLNDVRNRMNARGDFIYQDTALRAVRGLVKHGYLDVIRSDEERRKRAAQIWSLTALGEFRRDAIEPISSSANKT